MFRFISSWRGGNRTIDPVLIRDLLSPLSYAPMSGAEGTRTLACRIKSSVCCRRPCCARCPHDPVMLVGRMRFNRTGSIFLLLVVSSGSRPCCARCPESNSALRGYQPCSGNRPSTTICHRHCRSSRDGGTRTRALVLPRPPLRGGARRAAAALHPVSYQSNKKARCRCDTGLSVFSRNRYGLMSHAHWIGREHIRRLIGDSRPSSQFATQAC